jgi:hypothetical protein
MTSCQLAKKAHSGQVLVHLSFPALVGGVVMVEFGGGTILLGDLVPDCLDPFLLLARLGAEQEVDGRHHQ